jgi:hypothetical protein
MRLGTVPMHKQYYRQYDDFESYGIIALSAMRHLCRAMFVPQ